MRLTAAAAAYAPNAHAKYRNPAISVGAQESLPIKTWKGSVETMTGLKLPPVYQLGYVVRNIDEACEFYESTYGVGPFHIISEVDMEGAILRGAPISTKIKVAFAKSDKIELEFIEPLQGDNLYTEFLREKGDGIHHLGFVVDDMDVWKKEFAAKGFEPVFHHDMVVVEFAYFDTSVFGGLMLELLHWKDGEQPKISK